MRGEHDLMHRQIKLICSLALLSLLAACKSSPPPRETLPAVNPLDHVDSAHVKPINFLHKTFALKKTASFEFQVPAHTSLPRVHGTFQSSVPRPGGESLSDDDANVDLVLLNADQYSDFSHGRGEGTALYTVEPTHDHEVDFLLAPTQEDSVTYYVVFRNSPGGAPNKQVQADFSLTFGYP
jgi:hypothetical protein